MYGGSAPYLTARMHVDSLTPDTVSAVVAAAKGVEVTVDRRVEADVRLVLFPLASDLDLDVLLRDQDEEIGNVLVEHDVRTAAMRLHGELATMTTRGWGGGDRSQEPDSRFDVCTRGPSTSYVNGPGRGMGVINLEGAVAQALLGFSSGGRVAEEGVGVGTTNTTMTPPPTPSLTKGHRSRVRLGNLRPLLTISMLPHDGHRPKSRYGGQCGQEGLLRRPGGGQRVIGCSPNCRRGYSSRY